MNNEHFGWADAWQQLLIAHAPFRPTASGDFQELLRQLSHVEQIIIEHPRLLPYYMECLEADRSTVPADGIDGTINVAAMQMQLMEDAFFSLSLDQHPNAPDNRGWMNLFRAWSHSPTFSRHFKTLEKTYAEHFVDFYYCYVDGWQRIDDKPVPHAWDVPQAVPARERVPASSLLPEEQNFTQAVLDEGAVRAAIFAKAARTSKSVEFTMQRSVVQMRDLQGIPLDSGRREAGGGDGRAPGRRKDRRVGLRGEHSEGGGVREGS